MPITNEAVARFYAKVSQSDDPNGCHLWTGSAFTNGRGRVYWAGRTQEARRVAYELSQGPIPTDLVPGNTCGVRLCVCPDHLVLTTREEEEFRDEMRRGMLLPKPDYETPTTVPGVLAFFDAGWKAVAAAEAMSVRLDTYRKWLRRGLREREAAAGLLGMAA